MPPWASSTWSCYPCHQCTVPQDIYRPAGRAHDTRFQCVSRCRWLPYTKEWWMYVFEGCKFPSGVAGPLVLELPRLPPPRHPITKPPLLKGSSYFIPSLSQMHTCVISHCQPRRCPVCSPNPVHKQPVLLTLLPQRPRAEAAQSSPLRTAVWQDEQSLPGKSAPPWLTWKLVQ